MAGSSSSNTDPVLQLPSYEQVVADGTVAVAGESYSDSFAESNPGSLYLGVSDRNGLLYGFYPAAGGAEAPGSGTNSIVFRGSYAEVEAIINSLTYVATASGGTDEIRYDIWNQAGVETTGGVPVTIAAGGSPGPAPIAETWTGAVSSAWNTAGNWSGGVVPISGDTITIAGGTPNLATLSNEVLNGETIVLSGATVDFDNVTLDSQLRGSGTVQIGGTLTIGTGTTADVGQLSLTGTGDTIVNNGLILSPNGTIDLLGGGDGSDTSTLINNGSIAAGNIDITYAQYPDLPNPSVANLPLWAVHNAGTIAIADGGTFALYGTVSGGAIALAGSAMVDLEQPMALADGATISGIGPGDQFDLTSEWGTSLAFANGTLDVLGSAGVPIQAIGLAGSIALGNFQLEAVADADETTTVAYAPAGTVVVVPATATVAQGATLALNDVAISPQFPSDSYNDVDIDAGTGTLYLSGASGSGTHALVLGAATAQQLNTELANLAYVPAAGATSDSVTVTALPPAPLVVSRTIPISITDGGPSLHEPSSETVASGGSVAVAGSYSDSFAAGNPGLLSLGISDGTGTLTATNAAGQAAAGSGSHSIAAQADYVDVNAILASLRYTAGATSDSDTISFDVWNQAGVETIGATAVTIDPAAPAMTLADLATGSATSSAPALPDGGGGSGGATVPIDTPSRPIGVPLSVG